MHVTKLQQLLFAAAIVFVGGMAVQAQDCRNSRCGKPCGDCRNWQYAQSDLFANYYVPGACGGVPAQLYVSPVPTPAVVGHTYITNEAFMPHEFLYPHTKHYHRYYDDGRGFTRTSVKYYRPPVQSAAKQIGSKFKIAR